MAAAVATASCFHDCSEPEFLSKFSPQVKYFAILTCINTDLRCIKDCGLL